MLSPALRTRLQHTYLRALTDVCQIHRRQDGVIDAYGIPTALWITTDGVACRWTEGERGGGQRSEVVGAAEVPTQRSVVLLPPDVDIASVDEISITHWCGRELTPARRFAVLGHPQRTVTGVRVTIQEPALP